jgi:hypothetical protein
MEGEWALVDTRWMSAASNRHRIGHDAAGIRKAWESASSAERVVLEVPVGEDDSETVNEARLLGVFPTVPDNPSW